MNDIYLQVEYEKRGYRKGASAKLQLTGERVVIISNPKFQDNKIYVWVAMELDTNLRYMVEVEYLDLV